MFRSRINELFDQLRHEYDILVQENNAQKQHIKDLEEKNAFQLNEIKKTQAYIKDLNTYIKSMRRVPLVEIRTDEVPLKRLKLGSDWLVEGEPLLNIRLFKKYTLNTTITRCEVGSCVGIVCGRNCFLVDDGFYALNAKKDVIESIDYRCIKKPVIADEPNCEMCFSNDNAFVYTVSIDRIIRKWDIHEKKIVKKMSVKDDVVLMKCMGSSLVLVCKDLFMRVFEEDRMREISLGAKGLPFGMCYDGIHCMVSMGDKRLLTLNLENDTVNNIQLTRNLYSVDSRNGLLIGATEEGLSLFRINYEKMELEAKNVFKSKGRILICQFLNDQFVITAGMDTHLRIYDLETGRMMLLNGHSEYIMAFAVNKNELYTAGNDGKLKTWHFEAQSQVM